MDGHPTEGRMLVNGMAAGVPSHYRAGTPRADIHKNEE
jgi:hypothetical protein